MKKLVLAAAALLAAIWIEASIAETPLVFQPGEKKNVWFEIRERDGLPFNLQTATCAIFDGDGGTVGSCPTTISGGRFSSHVDAASWSIGSEYQLWVYWSVAESDENFINIVRLVCGEEIE